MYGQFMAIMLCVKYADSAFEGYILDGQFANIRLYPHQVFLDIKGEEECICGGSILNQAIVITAAHCFDDYSGKRDQSILVKYGSNNLESTKSKAMKAYKVNDAYDFKTMEADIALIACKGSLYLSSNVQRVALMRSPPERKTAYVAGWGAINDAMDTSDVLKFVKQSLQTGKMCSKLHLPVGSFCAGTTTGGHPGAGDSGGALVIDSYIQIGIVSYKIAGYTLIAYTNVSFYYNWVRSNAGNLYCKIRRL